MYRLFMILGLLLAFSEINAQWQVMNGPCQAGIGPLLIKDSTIYAGGREQCGEFFVSYDNGNHWLSINDGLPKDNSMYSLGFYGSTLYALGGHLYKTDIKDFHWKIADSDLPANSYPGKMINHDSLIFMQSKNGILVLGDSGNTWHLKPDGLPPGYKTLFTYSENRFYIGTQEGELFYSDDHCDTWIPYNTSTLPNWEITSLMTKDSIMIVGVYGGLYKTTDQGNNWTRMTDPQINLVFDEMFYDTTFFYASGMGYGLFRSQDEGLTWSTYNIGMIHHNINCLKQANGYLIASTSDGVYKSFDQGNTWTLYNEGLPQASILDCTMLGQSLFLVSYLGVSRSTDNGNTWEIVLSGHTSDEGIQCLCRHDSILFAGGTRGLYRSLDGGSSWIPDTVTLKGRSIMVIYSKDTLLFAGATEGLFRSIDNGNTWSLVLADQSVYAITISVDTVFVACYWGVFCSADRGTTWVSVNEGLAKPWLLSIHATQSKLFGGGPYLYRSAINPVSWAQSTNGISVLPNQIDEIISHDSLVFCSHSKGVYVTSNQGEYWFLRNEGFPELVFVNSLMTGDSTIYAGTYYGIYKRLLSEMYLLNVTPDSLVLDFMPGSMDTLYISTNANWTMTDSLPPWLYVSTMNGYGNDTVLISATEKNPTVTPRTIELTIVAFPAPARKITVTQKGKQAGTGNMYKTVVQIYPVPCRGVFYVESEFPINRITVYNNLGIVVETRECGHEDGKERFNIDDTGIFLVKIQTGNDIILKKVVIL